MTAVSSKPARVPVEERLFSLVLALLATDVGLMKNEILSTVHGYSQRYTAGGSNANLERQFERDKEDIRELGVPLETIDSPSDPGNNQLKRYRIPRGRYELPEDITFTPEESTLLTLAARVWREGSLSAESRRALIKLSDASSDSLDDREDGRGAAAVVGTEAGGLVLRLDHAAAAHRAAASPSSGQPRRSRRRNHRSFLEADPANRTLFLNVLDPKPTDNCSMYQFLQATEIILLEQLYLRNHHLPCEGDKYWIEK